VINALQGSATFGEILAVAPLPSSSTPGAASFPRESQLSHRYGGFDAGDLSQLCLQHIHGCQSNYRVHPNWSRPRCYGSNAFSTIVTVGGVPQMRTYTSNTINLTPVSGIPGTTPLDPNTVSVIEKPTIQCGSGQSISLTTTSGDIFR